MKVFVYKKSDSSSVKIIKNVKAIYEQGGTIIIDCGKKTYFYSIKEVKTTCYQN